MPTWLSIVVASVGVYLMDEFIKLQQEAIDQELAEMPPEEVNDMLLTMKSDEANEFLGRLGRLRATQIYKTLKWRQHNGDI